AMAGPYDVFSEQQRTLNLSPTASRLELIRTLLADIRASLALLRNVENETQNDTEEPPNTTNRPRNAQRRAPRALRNRLSRPSDLANLLDELEILEEEFAPYRANYIRLLHLIDEPDTPHYSGHTRHSTQHSLTIMSEVIHSFAHIYHTVSDITLDLGPRMARLISDAPIIRQTMPMQTHINVIQADRRPPQQQGAPGNENRDAAPAQTTDNSSANSDNLPSGQTGRADQTSQNEESGTATQSSEHVHSDPVTYQVEIETRVPIAIPIDNALITGLANSVNMTAPQPAENLQNQPQNQGAQQGQTNRRQVFFDLESLFQGLNQNGGVEVLMSMEEIPHVGVNSDGTASPNATVASNTTNSQQPPSTSGVPQNEGVYITQMPWGGPPGADLLQNIVASVIRQGLVPAVEGVALQGQTATPLIQGQVHSHVIANAQGQDVEIRNANVQANQGQQGTQDQPNRQAQQRPSLQLRHGTTTTRSQTVALANFIYDRFLHCDSTHARRRLERRRQQYQAEARQREELQALRLRLQNIANLPDRAPGITEQHMTVSISLLSGAPAPETWLNAFMLAVARGLFLSEPLQPEMGDTSFLLPSEYHNVRRLLRDFMQMWLDQSNHAHCDNALESVANEMMEHQSPFLNNVHTLVPLRSDVDMVQSIRTIALARVPVVVATVMSESVVDTLVERFYTVFTRLFEDICLLISYCCENALEGLNAIYEAYMAYVMGEFSDTSREVIGHIARVNLERTIHNMNPQIQDIRQFVHFRTVFESRPPLALVARQAPSVMEVQSSNHSTNEQPATSKAAQIRTPESGLPSHNADESDTNIMTPIMKPLDPNRSPPQLVGKYDNLVSMGLAKPRPPLDSTSDSDQSSVGSSTPPMKMNIPLVVTQSLMPHTSTPDCDSPLQDCGSPIICALEETQLVNENMDSESLDTHEINLSGNDVVHQDGSELASRENVLPDLPPRILLDMTSSAPNSPRSSPNSSPIIIESSLNCQTQTPTVSSESLENQTSIAEDSSSSLQNKTPSLSEDSSSRSLHNLTPVSKESSMPVDSSSILQNLMPVSAESAISVVSTSILQNPVPISENTSNILENQVSISKESSSIMQNQTSISEDSSSITQNQSAISLGSTRSLQNQTVISIDSSSILQSQMDIALDSPRTSPSSSNVIEISSDESQVSPNLAANLPDSPRVSSDPHNSPSSHSVSPETPPRRVLNIRRRSPDTPRPLVQARDEPDMARNVNVSQTNLRRRSPDTPRPPRFLARGQADMPQSAPGTPNVARKMDWTQWTEEFAPQLRSDHVDPNDNLQEPSSDLYLMGMSARKRRCIRQSRPPTTLVGFMAESVGEVTENRGNVQDSSPMRSAFWEHMRTMTRERATVSTDYDTEYYSAVDSFINIHDRTLTPPPSETDDEKNAKKDASPNSH
ncbi:hypothetical protein K1T71_000308, partial [Dendrolimus kikuchii]